MSRKFLQNPYSSNVSEDKFFGSACTPHEENRRPFMNQDIHMLDRRPQNPSDVIANNIPTPPDMLPNDISLINSIKPKSSVDKWSTVLNSTAELPSMPKMNRPQLKTNIPSRRVSR